MDNKRLYFIIISLASAMFLAGCASAPVVPAPIIPQGTSGVYHKVEKGQTLWKISKAYNVELDDLARINHISDTTAIEVGQLIFIPGRKKEEVLPIVAYGGDDFIWPARGRVVASFGSVYNNMINKGLNIRPEEGNDVVASRSGKVVFSSGSFGGFGKTLIIDHGDGLSTVYARNSELLVKAGDLVQKGQRIAKAGSAGRDKSVYLHFEVRRRHVAENPYYYLP